MKTESIKRQSGNLKLYLSAKVYHNRFAVLWVQFAQEGNMNQAIEQKRDFVFDDGSVKIRQDGDGEYFFKAKNIVESLGKAWNGSCLNHVPDEWKGMLTDSTPGGEQETVYLSEQGVYFYLLRSDSPKALPLQKKIAGEIMPAIRKTGQYAFAQISDADKIAEALILAGKQLAHTQERLAIAAPKAEAFDAFIDSDSWHTMSATAKTLKVGRNNLFKLLREKRIFTAENLPYNEHIQAHRFKVVQTEYKRGDAKLYADTTYVSCKGLAWLRQVVREAILDGLIDSL